MDIQREIEQYLHCCKHQKKLSALSVKAYTIDLAQFNRYFLASPEKVLSKTVVSGYIQELHQKYQPRTAKRKLASLRVFLNYLEFEEILDENPIHKIKTKFQEPKNLPKTIPLRSIELLLVTALSEQSHAKTSHGKFVVLRDRAILETLFATGMRVSELCSLKMSDVDLDDGTIRILGKGTKERIIQIGNKDVINSLREYQKAKIRQSDFFLSTGWLPGTRSSQFVKCFSVFAKRRPSRFI